MAEKFYPIGTKIFPTQILKSFGQICLYSIYILSIYSECKIHHTINTPEHIRAFHYNKIPPNINDILIEGYEVHEKIKKSESARKGKLYKFVQQRIEKYETVIKEILDSFKCD